MEALFRRCRAPFPHRRPRTRLPGMRPVLIVVAVVMAGSAALLPGTDPGPAPATSTAAATEPPAVLQTRMPRAATEPVRVRIPAIGADSALSRLGIDGAGALEVPTDPDRAGWFAGGPAPGDVGPAVLAGHVDSGSGPAVFWRLGDLVPGDEVLVDRADGTAARFTVTRVERHAKDAFPTDEVYGPTPDAQLRLVTCGGEFDRSARSYRDNVVVFAQLT